ncbi:TetR/AcrR family transcriptional regulator [Cupriavidus lacunae]|uniref:TetR/AcrR family transcriptional regulator n=1 Tax=Cupriavidus lacunae TaxID=2666307 RepID=A0A370P0E0_9BURK|nr:TetR/AcrR family transcriptional regulator [Cupriavidus lacunae]RDK11356.1 TetR/AcrR family transcriptional regulator [Cupriavidus lacunae]
MRYTKTHKEETRKKLLDASSAIAKRGGFSSTGVDALMSSIGLTGGAFYSHFQSKQELFAAIVGQEMQNSSDMLAGDEASPDNHVAKCIRDYLSSFHAMNPEVGCILPTLGAEIARSGPEVREIVERGLKHTHQSWRARSGDSDAAWALIAQCVGALVLARAVESEKARKEILAASRRFLSKTIPSATETKD